MYLCYYNCILTKAQGQLIITLSISHLHKPILSKDCVYEVTGLLHRLWKSPHQTSWRPSKGIKGVVHPLLLRNPGWAPLDRQGWRTKERDTRSIHACAPWGDGTTGQSRGKGQSESFWILDEVTTTNQLLHSYIQRLHHSPSCALWQDVF